MTVLTKIDMIFTKETVTVMLALCQSLKKLVAWYRGETDVLTIINHAHLKKDRRKV